MVRHGSLLACSLLAIALLAAPGAVLAANPPALTNYQGVLRGADDAPLSGDFDMVFRFYDAESGGNEILIDRHLAADAKAVTIDGGLFSVALGGGQVADGSGTGIYLSLADLFRDFTGVWLEVQVGAETLSPRTQVLATGFALNASTAATAVTATTALSAATAVNATQLDGQPASFYLNTGATRQVKGGAVRFSTNDASAYVLESVASSGSPGALYAQGTNGACYLGIPNTGAYCGGNSYGGYFYDANESSYAYTGYNVYGLYAGGPTYGTYSTAWGSTGTGLFGSGPQYGLYASASGASGVGIYGYGATAAHFNQAGLPNTYTKIAYSGYGLLTHSYNGIHAWDYDDGGYSRIGDNPYKIHGNGSVSFVQNHPDDPDRVVVYHAPESSEVNVYTRGSARLVKGAARVALDPTFAWTANPDLGLTAHLTPRGEPVALAVTAISTREIEVRGPEGSDVAFDYWVTGLRIGFEEMPPVKHKEIESAIPSKASGKAIYDADPELRTFNALERYQSMDRDLGRAVDPSRRASTALRNRIGTSRRMQAPDAASEQAGIPAPGAAPSVVIDAPGNAPDFVRSGVSPTTDGRPVDPGGASPEPRPRSSERFAATSSIDIGDVVVIDAAARGVVRRSDREDDRAVIGIALTPAIGGWVEVAVGSVAEVRVDAGYGAIRTGDLLASSPAPGAAMRARSAEAGTILGKALEPLESGLGTIRVLVTLR